MCNTEHNAPTANGATTERKPPVKRIYIYGSIAVILAWNIGALALLAIVSHDPEGAAA